MLRRVVADFDAEIMHRIGQRTDVTPVQRGFFLRDGFLAIAKFYDHVELQGENSETGLEGTDVLALTRITDLWWPTQLKDRTNACVLRPEDEDTIDNYPKASGKAARFYWNMNQFVLDCLLEEDTEFGIKYKIRPTMFTGNSPLDELYDPLIILKAAQMALETVKAYEEAGALRSLFKVYEEEHGLEPILEELKNSYREGFRVRLR